MTRKRKEKVVLTDAAKPPVAEEPQSMTTEEVAEWLTDKPKKKESAVFTELVALDPTWQRKRDKFRELWLDHVGARVGKLEESTE